MQNRNRIRTAEGVLSLLVLAVAQGASAIASPPLPVQPTTFLQQDTQAPPQQPAQPTQPPDHSQPPQKAVVLTGTIVKDGSDFVLKDSGGTVYKLDAPDKAAKFVGKAVKVTGQLEQAENQPPILHVQAIEPVGA